MNEDTTELFIHQRALGQHVRHYQLLRSVVTQSCHDVQEDQAVVFTHLVAVVTDLAEDLADVALVVLGFHVPQIFSQLIYTGRAILTVWNQKLIHIYNVCVCVCACMCACMCVCVSVCVRICVCVCLSLIHI